MLTNIVLDSLVTGLPLAPLTLGVYVVFRIRQDFDLTVEGSFALGAAVAAVLLVAVVHPFLAVVAGALAGAAAGARRLADPDAGDGGTGPGPRPPLTRARIVIGAKGGSVHHRERAAGMLTGC